MSTATGSGDFGNMLKNVYGPGVHNQIIDEVPLLNAIEDAGVDDLEIGGAGYKWVAKLATAGNGGHIAESTSSTTGKLFPANFQPTAQATANECECYGRISLTNKEMQSSKRSANAFQNALDFKMEGLVEELKRVAEVSLWGLKCETPAANGTGTTRWPTGVLGLADAAKNSGSTFTMDAFVNPQSLIGARVAIGSETNFETAAQVSNMTYRRITDAAINAAGTQVTATVDTAFSGNANDDNTTVSDNDIVVRGAILAGGVTPSTSDDDPNEYNRAIFGLDYIATTGTDDDLFGIDTGDNASWNPRATMTSVGVLTQSRINAWLRNIRTISGKHPDVLGAHGSALDAMAETIQPDVHYEPVELVGGYNRESFVWMSGSTKVPVIESPFCPLGSIYGWNWDALKLGYTQKWEWVEHDGLLIRQTDRVTYEAIFGAIWQTIVYQRNAIAKMSGITVDFSSLAFGS